ncbi:MAG TPA: hypothetical protein VH560_19915 [Polyangia bacterium]|nr:hypothetical protein [Polyangia bacterium]
MLIVAAAPVAQAAKRRVGVSVSGTSAEKIHEAIAVVLRHHGFESVRVDLGGDSDDAIAAAAKAGHLAAVVVGEVRDGGKRLKLHVHGASGELVGEASWAEHGGAHRLAAAVERTMWARVGGALSKTHALGEKAEPAAEEAPAAESESKSESKSKENEAPAAEPTPEPRKRKKHEAREADEAEAGATPAAGPALDFAVGPRFMSRSFSWSPQVPGLRGYSVSFAPSLGVNAAWYPAAHFRGGWVSNLGVGTNIEYTPGLKSETSTGGSYPTTATDFEGDVRYRLLLGGAGQLAFLVGGGQQSFVFHGTATSMRSDLADLPDVKYTYVRGGIDARFELPASFALMVAGAYRYVINAGKDGSLIQANQYFPNATFVAFDVSAGLGYRFLPMLEARVGFDLRRYQMTAGTNTSMVSSATDQYSALWLRLAFLLDGVAAGEGGAAAPPPKAAAAEPADKADKADDQKGADE